MDSLKSKLSVYRFEEGEAPKVITSAKVSKPKAVKIIKNGKYEGLEDLQPMITTNQKLMFIGFNPGVESSKQQHHYAHPTNLFWKLFNESGLFIKLVAGLEQDSFLRRVILNSKSRLQPRDDIELVRYGIGMTDLVLRCTKSVDELTTQEKISNIPRLIEEFNYTSSQYLVFIGKGIWEIVVKYVSQKYNIKKCKLTKQNFTWGEQTGSNEDIAYGLVLRKLQIELNNRRIYVFPNTSGLVTSLTYIQKIALWNQLVDDI